MTLNQIIGIAAQYLDMPLTRGEFKKTLLKAAERAYRSVITEHLPLWHTEEIEAADGKIYFSGFGRAPIRIRRVTRNGRRVRFGVFPDYITVGAAGIYSVKYSYFPEDKHPDAQLDLNLNMTPQVMALGAAAEYALQTGLYEKAVLLQDRFRDSLRSLITSRPDMSLARTGN